MLCDKKVYFILAVLYIHEVLSTSAVISSWEYGVVTRNEIVFFNHNWTKITSFAHEFKKMWVGTLDEVDGRLYFSNHADDRGGIFSLELQGLTNEAVEHVLPGTSKNKSSGLAYDYLERTIYWSDYISHKIYKKSISDPKSEPVMVYDLGMRMPNRIAVDFCRRKLYITSTDDKEGHIEQVSLDGSDHKVIVTGDMHSPSGIFIDQYSKKIYWINIMYGKGYTIERANLDGTDREVLLKNYDHLPIDIVVDGDWIFYTDHTTNSILKTPTINASNPEAVTKFLTVPGGIFRETNFLSLLANDPVCGQIVESIKKGIYKPARSVEKEFSDFDEPKGLQICMNNGTFNFKAVKCICTKEYTGLHCEMKKCHNFCINGVCEIGNDGYPKCSCTDGYYGKRCENNKCADYCLNGGICQFNNGVPECQCSYDYNGHRCEVKRNQLSKQELCNFICESGLKKPEERLIAFCKDVCILDVIVSTSPSPDRPTTKRTETVITDNIIPIKINPSELNMDNVNNNEKYLTCSNAYVYNKTIIIIVVGVILALVLVVVIIVLIRRVYKPARPRIKKTFVVHKQTPLTSRPITSQQCEITIEDCCNMNICETPCFDPKSLQLSCEKAHREDEYKLIDDN